MSSVRKKASQHFNTQDTLLVCVSLLPTDSFLIDHSRSCNQHYHLELEDEAATNSGPVPPDLTENTVVVDDERAEMRQLKHMHIPVSKVAAIQVTYKKDISRTILNTLKIPGKNKYQQPQWDCCKCGPKSIAILPFLHYLPTFPMQHLSVRMIEKNYRIRNYW